MVRVPKNWHLQRDNQLKSLFFDKQEVYNQQASSGVLRQG